jgi:hypothetical protein
VKLIERFAIAALAILDPLNQTAQQAVNGALIHGLGSKCFAAPGGTAAVPACF